MVNVICVKYGDLYNHTHVNRLYEMVKRNLSLPFSFYCLTDNSENINKDIIISDIKKDYELYSYWWKFCVFDPKIYQQNEMTLYLDLDTIIFNSIDRLFLEAPEDKLSIAFTGEGNDLCKWDPIDNVSVKWKSGVNSSIMIFNPEMVKNIWEEFYLNADFNMLEYFGVCRYIWNNNRDQLRYLYPPKDWSSFLKGYTSIPFDGKKVKFRKDRAVLSFHDLNSPICILAGASKDKVLEDIFKYFSSYYE